MNPKAIVFLKFLSLSLILSCGSCKKVQTVNQKPTNASVPCQIDSEFAVSEAKEDGFFKAHKSKSPIEIDGCSKDAIWSSADWYAMNYLWMGDKVDPTDYHGRFKLAWDNQYLYILVEVIDQTLSPTLVNGIDNYWKGDYVEVFIDEDKSGGNHKFNHQAFAYHVSTEGHAIDKNTLEKTVFFDDHIEVARSQEGNTHIWEMSIKLFDNQFNENSTTNTPVKISAQKSIGFSIAYGDNDGNNIREHFIGSKKTHGNNNDDGYINSDVFGSILFVE
ncbi:sugar-binding protein [Lacinutrix jangbogonensis]|uniref:sugar-binding protein n=1 Tax=Lacinutrix jangbogonensis TaxID=1469557 RepID=UPI000689BEA8|nr:sugar-binding protein [Lacinutrix jangbogonensis]